MSKYAIVFQITSLHNSIKIESWSTRDPDISINQAYVNTTGSRAIFYVHVAVDTMELPSLRDMYEKIYETLERHGIMYGINEYEFYYDIDLHCRMMGTLPTVIVREDINYV